LVAVAADEQSQAGRAQGAVRLATSIEANWLLEDFGSHIEMKDELLWNADAERVERLEGMAFGAILLDEARSMAPPSPEASQLLCETARARGVFSSLLSESLAGLVSRLALLREHFPEAGLPEITSGLDDEAAARLCAGKVSFAELRTVDPALELRQALGPTAPASPLNQA
jgi:ATP-dependent helicase HrpB